MMAEINLTLRARKRWFFWPAVITFVMLGKLRILRDPDWAGKWLADHAMVLEVERLDGTFTRITSKADA